MNSFGYSKSSIQLIFSINLEIFIGGGSSQSNYKYYNKEGNRIYENPDVEIDFNQSGEELVYKGGVMLTYKL